MQTEPELSAWTAQEISLIQTVELFQLKPIILKKAESRFERLREPISRFCKESNIAFPEATDFTKGQIARGENHKGFPYISYDLPQKFSKTEFYTFRALFWWGHYLGFSLILKGNKLAQYTNNLMTSSSDEIWNKAYYSTSPWEWGLDDGNFKSISKTDPKLIAGDIEESGCLKLFQYYPVNDPGFADLNWEQLGLEAFKAFSSITR